jgi:hypothetical protein
MPLDGKVVTAGFDASSLHDGTVSGLGFGVCGLDFGRV